MNFNEIPEFSKEFKDKAKKYLSLSRDLDMFKRVVSEVPLGNGKHFTIITIYNDIKIIKARLFCEYLSKSSLRIIYSYKKQENLIEFLELYFKGDKENENRERIKDYLKSIKKV
jgi:hypothetical protein